MRKWFRVIGIIMLAVILALPISTVLANWLLSPAPIVVDLADGGLPASVLGANSQPEDNSFYAVGRHWMFYVANDTDIVYKSALPGGILWTGAEVVPTAVVTGFDFSVWYDYPTNTVHYARIDRTGADHINYRMGTPNADGTLTWAAVEQPVLATPGDLVTSRITISVDEDGFPWVAWVDTDGVTPAVGVVYVESSSTKNGIWTATPATSAMFVAGGGTIADGSGTLGAPGSPITLVAGIQDITIAVAGTFTVTLPAGNTGVATSGGWVVTGTPQTLNPGANTITVEAGGANHIHIETLEARHDWFISLTPIAPAAGNIMELGCSSEDLAGNMGLYSTMYNSVNGWSAITTVAAEGVMSHDRPDGFSFLDHGSSVWCVYTDITGDVYARVRSSIQTWNTAGAATKIIDEIGDPWLPTLSIYRLAPSGSGYDMICIVHDILDLKYSIYSFDTSTWSAWNLIWSVPNLAEDVISRHGAAYSYHSPVGFYWQWNDATTNTDTIYYWWIDNSNDQLGYYAGSLPATATPLANIIPLIFLGMGILIILALSFADNVNLKMLIFIAIAIMLIFAFLGGINGMVNGF
jgi:hypothetical protein